MTNELCISINTQSMHMDFHKIEIFSKRILEYSSNKRLRFHNTVYNSILLFLMIFKNLFYFTFYHAFRL